MDALEIIYVSRDFMVEIPLSGCFCTFPSDAAFGDVMVEAWVITSWKQINEADEDLIHCLVDCLVLGKWWRK